MLELYNRELRIELEYPDMRREVLPGVVRHIRPAPGMSFVSFSRLAETNLDAAIDVQVEFFTQQQLRFSWKVLDHDTPSDLKTHLLAHGFQPDDPAALMALDLQQVPRLLNNPLPPGVSRLTTAGELEQVIHIEEQVWGGNFDWMRLRMGAHLGVPGYLSIYIARVENPTCLLALDVLPGWKPVCQPVGWVYHPAIPPEGAVYGYPGSAGAGGNPARPPLSNC